MKLLGHYVYPPIALLAAVEFIASSAAFVASAAIMRGVGLIAELGGEYVATWALMFAAAVLTGMTAVGLYQAKQRLRIEGVIARIFVGLTIAAICLALVDFFLSLGIGGPIWAVSFVISLVALSTTRGVLWRWVDHEAFQRRVLVYGAGERAATLLKLRRRSDRRGFNIAAFVPAVGDKVRLEDPRVHALEIPLVDYAKQHGIDEIVVAMDERRQGFPVADLLACRFVGIYVVDLLGFLERETGTLKVDLVNPAWLIFSDGFQMQARFHIATRAFDFLSALTMSIVASPLMLAAAAAVALDDGWPVLYRQSRVGLTGKEFTLYKFRSMIKEAEADGAARWAGASDSRVTRVGKFLRKTRLDELPQLLNVLRGDMSIVGPRPERPEFVRHLAKKIPYYHERHSVKPGITGWAQLCYPYGSSDEDAMEKLQFDLYYIKHKSLVFDLIVLLQTAEVVLWGKGAR